jgi:hypothetical protein
MLLCTCTGDLVEVHRLERDTIAIAIVVTKLGCTTMVTLAELVSDGWRYLAGFIKLLVLALFVAGCSITCAVVLYSIFYYFWTPTVRSACVRVCVPAARRSPLCLVATGAPDSPDLLRL